MTNVFVSLDPTLCDEIFCHCRHPHLQISLGLVFSMIIVTKGSFITIFVYFLIFNDDFFISLLSDSIWWLNCFSSLDFVANGQVCCSSYVVNKLNFVEYWMFKFGLTENVKCSSLAWVWAKPTNCIWAWTCQKV